MTMSHSDQCDHCRFLELFILERLSTLEELVRMTQADVDAETAAVNAEAAKNEAAFVSIQAEIAALEAQIAAGTPIANLDGLKAAVATLTSADADVASLETAPAEPTA